MSDTSQGTDESGAAPVQFDPLIEARSVAHPARPHVGVVRSRRPSRRWLAPIGICLAPMVAFFSYGIAPFYIQNGVDPFIYSGYIFEPADLITRYGYTYYSVRFGLLLPAQFFQWALGTGGGYFGLRWVAMSAALAVGYLWCRQLGLRSLGWLAGALFLVNPVVIRAVTTVYSDMVGVPCVFAAFALSLTPGSTRTHFLAAAGAGVCVGLTVNANPYFAVPIGAALAARALTHAWINWRQTIIESAITTTMIMLVTGAGALYYKVRFGDGNIIQPTIDAARRLPHVASPDRAPTRQWLNFRPFLWLPLLSVAALVTSIVRQRSRPEWFEVASIAMLAAVAAVFLQDEVLAHGYFLETYYYTSYFIGPTIIVMVLSVRRLVRSADVGTTGLALLVGAIVLFPFVWKVALEDLQVWSIPTIPILLLAIVILVRVRSRAFGLAGLGALVLSPLLLTLANPRNVPLASGQAQRREPHYEKAMFAPQQETLDRYELASRFMSTIPDWSQSPGSVIFWYPLPDETANLMASTFLWLETSLTTRGLGLPDLSTETVQHLQQRTPRYLVLVTSSTELGDQGVKEIRTLLTPISDDRTILRSGKYTVVVDTLKLQAGSCDLGSQGREFYWVSAPPC